MWGSTTLQSRPQKRGTDAAQTRDGGQSPTLKAKPSLAAKAALSVKEALKGYGGKQEFSPGLFLPKAGKDEFIIHFSMI